MALESLWRGLSCICVFVQDRTPGRGPAPAAFYTDLPPPVKDSSCSDCGSVQSPLSQQCQPLIHQTAPAHSLERSLHVGPLIHSPPVSPCNPRRVLSSRHLPLFSTTCNLLMTHSAIIEWAGWCGQWESVCLRQGGHCCVSYLTMCPWGRGAGMVSGRTRLTTSSPTQNLCHRYFGIMRV